MHVRPILASFAAVLGLWLALSATGPERAARAAEIFGNELTGGATGSIRVKSMAERRYLGIVRQQTDFSCGAAAVATILRFGYGVQATEESVLVGMLERSDPVLVRERGFSLLDIKHYVQAMGMQGVGLKLGADQLSRLRVPAIALLDLDGYYHFVVLKRADGAYAYLADPALGNRTMPLRQFAADWNGIVFVIVDAGYRRDNALVAAQRPLGTGEIFQGTPTMIDPLSNSNLIWTGVPPSSRL